jgi:hypothetical protein
MAKSAWPRLPLLALELILTGEPGAEPRLQPRADDCKRCADDPLVTHAQNGEAGTVAHNAEPISNSAMDAIIERIQAGFARRHGAALPVVIKRVRGMGDLAPAVRTAARRGPKPS